MKHPAYAIVAVLTLAVGVGANAAIFSVPHAVVLGDLPYRDADRLALLWSVNLRQPLPDADALGVIARLSPTSTFASAQTEMTAIATRLREQYPQFNADQGILVERITDRVSGRARRARSGCCSAPSGSCC